MSMVFIIPVYRHARALEGVIKNVLAYNLPIIVVDDGNPPEEKTILESIAKKYATVTLISLSKNGGKGRAFTAGVKKAIQDGFSHAFQVDADGQHDTSACAAFISASNEQPNAVICGFPLYDETVPPERKSGREFSNKWARFVSLNKNIKDVLCGFRIYPLEPYKKILRAHTYINGRMGFDPEILVRLLWKGVPLVNKEVRVSYPSDGISNFRMVKDNIGISFTFARLCCGMLVRLPLLLLRAIRGTRKT